jgi:hypothetical protein
VAGNASTPEAIAEAAATLGLQLRTGLSPWIGAEGYAALHARALQQVRTHHPALGELSLSADDRNAAELAVRAHGAAAVSGGIVAFVATLIELLGKIIGVEMALRLVEHWGDRARAES